MRVPASLLAKYDRPVPRYTSYPTSPHFGAMDEHEYREWLAKLPATEPVSLYIHLPFCKELCHYCGCHMKVVNNEDVTREYVAALIQELALLAAATPRRLHIGQVHLGGGTPNHMPAGLLNELMQAVRTHTQLLPEAELAAELDPRVHTAAFAAAMAENGFNRASLGVQTLNARTQQAINRIQPYEMVQDVVAQLRAAGIANINLDLMYGLPYQNAAGMIESVDMVCELSPSRLALFGYAHVPQMKKHQLLLEEHGLPDTMARHEMFVAAAERLSENGYVQIGMDHFARPDDALAIAARAGTLRRNFQGYTADSHDTLLGIGVSSISQLPQGYAGNELDVRAYKEDIAAGRLPVRRGLALHAEDMARREMIHTLMSNGRVNALHIAESHNMDATHLAPVWEKLKVMQEDGLCLVNDGIVELTPTGWGLVRSVAAAFDDYIGRKIAIHSKPV